MNQQTDENRVTAERLRKLLAHIDEGTRQLRAGEFKEYELDDLERFRADIRDFKVM